MRPTEYQGPDGKTYWNPFFPTAELTPDIFWAHFAPEVQALREMGMYQAADALARSEAAFDLLTKGFVIPSFQISIDGNDPVTFCGTKFAQGFTWYPALGEPDVYPQAKGFPLQALGLGVPYDPDHAPKRSFPCSLLKKDWVPFITPPPLTPNVPAALPMVGNFMGAGFYGRGAGAKPDTVIPGKEYTAPDGKIVIAVVNSDGIIGMGWSCYFKLK